MDIFSVKGTRLSDLKEMPFERERDLQEIFERNLNSILGLEFIKSEFSIQNQRFDTLAFDTENSSFVIIEYKKTRNDSVFDQGVLYLNTLLKFKADFIVEYNETLNKTLKKDSVDWTQSRVIFVAPAFSERQKGAIDFRDLNIELVEVKRFENDILVINGVKKSLSAPSIKFSDKMDAKTELKELKTYTEDEHLNNKSEDVKELYEDFKQAILNLSSSIEAIPQKLYVAFKINKKTIASIEIQKSTLKLCINKKKGELKDARNIMKDVFGVGHWGSGDYQITIKNSNDLEYIMSLIKQAI